MNIIVNRTFLKVKTDSRIAKWKSIEFSSEGNCLWEIKKGKDTDSKVQEMLGVLSKGLQATYLQLEVELHVAPARVVRVLLEDEPEGRFSLVQVAVLKQELLLGIRPRHQPVLHLVVSVGGGSRQQFRYHKHV